jgi:hypothetical protein
MIRRLIRNGLWPWRQWFAAAEELSPSVHRPIADRAPIGYQRDFLERGLTYPLPREVLRWLRRVFADGPTCVDGYRLSRAAHFTDQAV